MSNAQNNTNQNVPSEKSITSANTDKQSHFVQAHQIIKGWPKWKRNIRCMPNSINGNQPVEIHEKT